MKHFKYLFLMLAMVSLSNAIKINVQGSVSLGKEILESLSHYLKSNGAVALMSRRSGSNVPTQVGPEYIKASIQYADVCRGLKIYDGPLAKFMQDYIIIITTAIETIFEGITYNGKDDNPIFEGHLKMVLNDIREILKEADANITDDRLEGWIAVIKRIGARYQNAAITFVEERLEGDPQDISNVKKNLIQRVVLALVLVENKYESKLCQEQHICEKSHLVTNNLNNLLTEFEKTDNNKAMEFIKYFYENLEPENLFSFLNMDTSHELQVILSDLSYSKNAPAKDVLLSVQRTINERLQILNNDEMEFSKAYDHQLVNIILSDMDFFYNSLRKKHPFVHFMEQFLIWHNNGGKFAQPMRTTMKEIKTYLNNQSPDLMDKLRYEVRVFLELTVDPEK